MKKSILLAILVVLMCVNCCGPIAANLPYYSKKHGERMVKIHNIVWCWPELLYWEIEEAKENREREKLEKEKSAKDECRIPGKCHSHFHF